MLHQDIQRLKQDKREVVRLQNDTHEIFPHISDNLLLDLNGLCASPQKGITTKSGDNYIFSCFQLQL